MRTSVLLTLVLVAGTALSGTAFAQEEEGPSAYWYVSAYNIPWEKVDSLQSLNRQYTAPVVEDSKQAGRILDRKMLIHHTANEYNVIIMTKFPSWEAIDRGAGFDEFAEQRWDEAKNEEIEAAFDWVFEGAGAHQDWIYGEAE